MNLHLASDEEFIRQLTDMVLAHLDDDTFGVDELVERSGLSHSVLRRRLKAMTQKTINHFISEIRLLKAHEILSNERYTVSEVASMTGFSTPAYFNTCFHEHFGYPPGEVKKKNSEKTASREEISTDIQVEQAISFPVKLKKNLLKLILKVSFVFFLFGIAGVVLYRIYTLRNLEKSIAVLPFINLGEDKADQYFADGVMDDILSNLSKMKGLRVISRTSTEQFREPGKSMEDIAGTLHVNFILEGTVQKYGDHLRLRVQLIMARHREDHLWSETYDRKIMGTRDIFNVQSEIAQAIASELRVAITPEEKQLIEKTPTTSLAALDFYRRGREEHLKYQINNDNTAALINAERFFHHALESDSTYAKAYAGLAAVYWDKHYLKDYLRSDFLDSVAVLSDKALSLDGQLPEALYLKGVFFLENGDLDKAEEELDKSIRFNPNYWLPYFGKDQISLVKEDLLKAIENLEIARSLNSNERELMLILLNLGIRYVNAGFPWKAENLLKEFLSLTEDSARYFYMIADLEYVLGHHAVAVESSKKACRLEPLNATYLFQMAYYLSLTGHFKEALGIIGKTDLSDYNEINKVHRIGYIFWEHGRAEEANDYFDRQIVICRKAIESKRPFAEAKWAYYDLAAVFAFRGNKEEALKNLRIYNEKTIMTFGMLHYIKTDPLLDNLRGEAEFQQIVKDQERKHRAEHERVRKGLEAKGLL